MSSISTSTSSTASDSASTAAAPAGPTPDRILQMVWGFAPTLILSVAIRHRAFDFIDEAPRTAEEVAGFAQGSVRGWRAVLNALTGFAFLTKSGDRYSTTPESSTFLVTTKPTFTGGLYRHAVGQLIKPWMTLDEVVKTGAPAAKVNDANEGQDFFVELVTDIMPLSFPPAHVLGQYLLGRIRERGEGNGAATAIGTPFRVLDIASGSGVWGIGLAQQVPNVHVTAVDWPKVLDVTRSTAGRFGLAEQFDYVAGDLLEVEYPGQGEYDAATLGHIIHSEGEDRSKALLRKVFAALKPCGVIAIAEFLPNAERSGPPAAVIFAVNMLVHTELGDTYPFEEISAWLLEAGFVNPRLLEAPGPSPLVLADKPEV